MNVEHAAIPFLKADVKSTSIRYRALDTVRGLALLNMIAYHGIWDLVYLYGMDWEWYTSLGGYLWQQGICWSFILLSGFCYAFGRKKAKRGLCILACGILISAGTELLMPERRVQFGILTFLGSCMLLLIPLKKLLMKIPSGAGFLTSLVLFVLFRNINQGFLGFETFNWIRMPGQWYKNLFTAYLGFPAEGFFSTDYFSLLPWMLLFLAGFFLCRILKEKHLLDTLKVEYVPALGWLGRHSLLIYLLHQPILYVIFQSFFQT